MHRAPPHAHPSDPLGVAPGRAIRACLEEQRCDRCPQRLAHSTWPELSTPVQNLCSPDSPRRARLVPSGPEHCLVRAHSPAPHSTYPQPKKTVRQAPLSMGFSRQENWSGLPCPPPGDPPIQGLNQHPLCLLHWPVPPGSPVPALVRNKKY